MDYFIINQRGKKSLSNNIFFFFFFYCVTAGSKYAVIDGRLHVSQVTIEDARLSYRCSGRHRLFEQQQPMTSSPARIVLSASSTEDSSSSSSFAPRLTISSQRQLVVVSASSRQSSVYLSCPVVAQPAPKIRSDSIYFYF